MSDENFFKPLRLVSATIFEIFKGKKLHLPRRFTLHKRKYALTTHPIFNCYAAFDIIPRAASEAA
jgi:hypothetical protein